MPHTKVEIKLTSTAFEEGGMIPEKYTCDGPDISPAMKWSGVPETAQSVAIIMDDPDAPVGTWVHWVLYNLPPTIDNLPGNLPALERLANGERQGMSDFKRLGYGGPCPPGGTHRYFFKIYALDTMLPLEGKVTKAQVEKAMEGHIVAQGQLMGRYKRK